MRNESAGRYYVKNTENGTFEDITTKFNGVAVLKLTGLNAKGKPVNIYTAQWVNSQKEDFMITSFDANNNPKIIRENVDIELTFIVRAKYATGTIDVKAQHDAFVDYMTNTDVWLKSKYLGNKYAHCVCQKEYKPTTIKYDRGDNTYIMGTITLHTLDAPSTDNV